MGSYASARCCRSFASRVCLAPNSNEGCGTDRRKPSLKCRTTVRSSPPDAGAPVTAVSEVAIAEPRCLLRALGGRWRGGFRLRVEDWRAILRMKDEIVVVRVVIGGSGKRQSGGSRLHFDRRRSRVTIKCGRHRRVTGSCRSFFIGDGGLSCRNAGAPHILLAGRPIPIPPRDRDCRPPVLRFG